MLLLLSPFSFSLPETAFWLDSGYYRTIVSRFCSAASRTPRLAPRAVELEVVSFGVFFGGIFFFGCHDHHLSSRVARGHSGANGKQRDATAGT